MFYPELSDCPHLFTAVGFMTAKDFFDHLTVEECDICGDENGLWMCLYPDCYMLGCSDDSKDHSTQHYEEAQEHCIQLNISQKRIWCYKCSQEVIIRGDGTKKFGALIPPPKSGTPSVRASTERENQRRHPKYAAGLVGLINLGNTCYMNAALQCLLNLPALSNFFLNCSAHFIHTSDARNPMSKAFRRLNQDIWNNGGSRSFVSPNGVLTAIRSVFPMFRGFQQHDSQEFLRCLMDIIHEELMEPTFVEIQNFTDNEVDDDDEMSVDEEFYETAEDSGVSEQSSVSSSSDKNEDLERTNNRFTNQTKKQNQDAGIGTSVSTLATNSGSDCEQEFLDAASTISGGSGGESPMALRNAVSLYKSNKNPVINKTNKTKPVIQRSVISDLFDGKLVSSVQCLTCNRVSATTEVFQDLSLPIPTQDVLMSLRESQTHLDPILVNSESASNQGWISWAFGWIFGWFYGPDISLVDCFSYFFSADELKGDNMYSCEKCKKLRNGLKYSRVTVLPDTLCIHLKRFRHEFAFSSKISSRVTFPLVDLDLSPWLHKDHKSNVSNYDLSGLICHKGSAGGGHYIAYAQNPINNEWYEFDDSSVTKVDAAHVMNTEAYVLFYRKSNSQHESVRNQLQNILKNDQENPGLIQFFISRQWLNKFENLAEPGPIDNYDFLCLHGNVLPAKSEHVYDMCVSIPQSAWQYLHNKYGGGPTCNRIQECAQCRMELDALNKQRLFEVEEFKALHKEFQEDNNPTAIYCLSASWFKKWEGFVTQRLKSPPGPIDNKAIVVSTKSTGFNNTSGLTLRPNSDYLQISLGIWVLFFKIYGGGPEVLIRCNGQIIVNTTPLQPALSTRVIGSRRKLRSPGSIIVAVDGSDSSPPLTRSKSRSISETYKSEYRSSSRSPLRHRNVSEGHN